MEHYGQGLIKVEGGGRGREKGEERERGERGVEREREGEGERRERRERGEREGRKRERGRERGREKEANHIVQPCVNTANICICVISVGALVGVATFHKWSTNTFITSPLSLTLSLYSLPNSLPT